MLALSAGLGVSTWSFINERKARQSAATAAANATAHARIAEEQRGVADRLSRESQQLADRLKSTLTRADFIAGSEQLEAGKVSRALSFLVLSSQAAKLLQWWDVSAVGVPSRKAQLEHHVQDFNRSK
jgi:hypothetical protein